mgnify:CR=1 FL=1
MVKIILAPGQKSEYPPQHTAFRTQRFCREAPQLPTHRKQHPTHRITQVDLQTNPWTVSGMVLHHFPVPATPPRRPKQKQHQPKTE